MIESIFVVVLLSFFLYYLFFLWSVLQGLKSTSLPCYADVPTVSIVIAMRNEQANIIACLEGLTQQDYPADHYEIVIVDDHSTDRSAELAEKYAVTNHRIPVKVISLSDADPLFGKPAAIARGVEMSSGTIILCTDADCRVPRRWLRSMACRFESSVVFVAGPVVEDAGDDTFSRLQSLEFLGIITTAAGLIGFGTPIICNGANIAYRRDAFLLVAGYGSLDSSCDDETLMQRMVKRKTGRVVFNADPEARVSTSTPLRVRDFWIQRTRWAAKRGRYEDGRILVKLLGLYGFFVAAFVAALCSPVMPMLGITLLGVILVKAAAEFLVLRTGAAKFEVRIGFGYFVIAELFHVPYIVVAAAIGQLRAMRWKGRTLDR